MVGHFRRSLLNGVPVCGQMRDQTASGVEAVVAAAERLEKVMPAHFRAEQSLRFGHLRADEGVSASFGDRFGAEFPRVCDEPLGEFQVMHEPPPADFSAEAVQQDPNGLFGRERRAVIIDHGQAVAVAVECQSGVRPFAIDGLAQLVQQRSLGAVGRMAGKIVLGRIVNRGEKALRKDGVQIRRPLPAQQPCMGSTTRCNWAFMASSQVSCRFAT